MPELCRKYGVAQATFYRWRQKYGALTKSELARLKDLERENARLKRLVADSRWKNRSCRTSPGGNLERSGSAALSALMYSFFSAADRRHCGRGGIVGAKRSRRPQHQAGHPGRSSAKGRRCRRHHRIAQRRFERLAVMSEDDTIRAHLVELEKRALPRHDGSRP